MSDPAPHNAADAFYAPASWYVSGQGPRYRQLARHIANAIRSGTLAQNSQLPPERDLADQADVSRVTVRKAVAELVAEGLIAQHQGAGSFVQSAEPRFEHSLSTLVSFTENMRARGMTSTSEVISAGLYTPTPDEMVALGQGTGDKVARIERLRSADGIPMALERSSLPADILPDPSAVKTSLYNVLRRLGRAPSRALQRVAAINLEPREAGMLDLAPGAAVLQIERTAYIASGRPVELTLGLYRSDIYNFLTELRSEDGA